MWSALLSLREVEGEGEVFGVALKYLEVDVFAEVEERGPEEVVYVSLPVPPDDAPSPEG